MCDLNIITKSRPIPVNRDFMLLVILSQVVVIYDYQANRSDELTMVRGDIIKVLYKDGPSWWFGEKRSDMTQGYFPTSYVSAQGVRKQ